MERNLVQKICTVCLIVALVVTCILWGIDMDRAWVASKGDDIFGAAFLMPLGSIVLVVALAAEIVFFVTLRGILAPRAYKLWKRLLCAVVFLGNLLAVTWVICYIR